MAINHEKREDLMRDATAYVRRLTIPISIVTEPIFLGLRQHGGWSVYFGEDPVFQFNAQHKLRRVHFDNQNFAASDGRLILLDRVRLGGQVEFQRIHLADTERSIIANCHKRLYELAEVMETHRDSAVCFPEGDRELVSDLLKLVQSTYSNIQIADTANA